LLTSKTQKIPLGKKCPYTTVPVVYKLRYFTGTLVSLTEQRTYRKSQNYKRHSRSLTFEKTYRVVFRFHIPYIQKIGTHVLDITVQIPEHLGPPIQAGGSRDRFSHQLHKCAVYTGTCSDTPEHSTGIKGEFYD
jgi:hypothetical protein